jgi:peptide/nickel transport system ATP-binding protein
MMGAQSGNAPLLEVRDLKVHFEVGRNKRLKAVDGVDVVLEAGRTLALVGESGSGKSTLGRAIVRLQAPTSGEILLNGREIGHLKGRALKPIYEHLQMVFQNPMTSLSPRQTVLQTLSEPLILFRRGDKAMRRRRAEELMDRVGMRRDLLDSLPQQLSGGQRQRVGIARALALKPEFIVADEPVSALDVSVRAQVVNLLQDIQRDLGLSLLFIAHDLSVVRHISHRVAILYSGKLVEIADRDQLYERPIHPYTEALLSAVPVPDPKIQKARKRLVYRGEIVDAGHWPSGCHLHGRCPYATEKCALESPPLVEKRPGHFAACWHR